MCGIAGIWMKGGRRLDPEWLDRLAGRLVHRGPDAEGRFLTPACGLVHRRLSIVDLETGDQPLFGPEGTVLIANGEIYNDPALRAELAPAPFRTRSDCEPILFLYAREGSHLAPRLRGMYAFALFDPPRHRLVLARDPFGIKPLYYTDTPAYFAFASEPQALLGAGLAPAEIDTARRDELLNLKFTTGRDTIFPAIKRVLPGETLVIEEGEIRARHLYDPLAGLAQNPSDPALLDGVLTESVALHLRSDVPYGLFLSGGIDSSALLWLMHRLSATPVLALTIGYDGADASDESAAALAVARAVGAKCERLRMTEDDFWRYAPRIAAALDDPTTDAAALPTWLLGQGARQSLKVVLCGEGGDEMFGGYGRYRRLRWPWRWVQRPARSRGVFDGLPGFRFGPWREGLTAAEAEAARRPGLTPLQRAQLLDCREWLPNDLLIKLDRTLMSHGVEGRTPLVDPVVAAYALALPDHERVGLRRGKLILRRWLAERLPEARPFARKKGFKPPIGRWLASRRETLLPLLARQPALAPIATQEGLAAALTHDDGQTGWSVLFYALWHACHIQRIDTDGDVLDVLAAAADRSSPKSGRAAVQAGAEGAGGEEGAEEAESGEGGPKKQADPISPETA
jgi:asparagine synthase (glutamine-hydrolysing)